MVVTHDKFIAQAALNPKGDFQNVAGGPFVPQKNDEVSIQCYHGPADAERWIRFDDFRIERLE